VAAGVIRAAAVLVLASSTLGAQANVHRLVSGVFGTPQNRIELWSIGAAEIGLTLTRGDRSAGCGASVKDMRVWADSLERFSERLRGYSAVDTATVVSSPIPGCGIVGVGAPSGGARSYAVRHVDSAGVATQVAVTPGTFRRMAVDVRALAQLVDSVAAQIAKTLGMQPDDPRLRTAPPPMSPDEAFFDFQVDRTVRPVSGSAAPRYPASLRSQGIEGEVLARFVVDTTGVVVEGSIGVLRSSHPEFEAAVRLALPRMLFSPAIKDGRNVRQLVQQPFIFQLERDQ
jgi:TonB family protein